MHTQSIVSIGRAAALLQRMGELCVLHQAQNWEDLGHSLEDHQLLAALQRYSRDFADALKDNWRLPVPLLELINATHELPSSNLKRELILMRLAAVQKQRIPWMAGAGLLVAVVAKLFFIDLTNVGGVERIVSFLGVGALMLAIGYLAPFPSEPKTEGK